MTVSRTALKHWNVLLVDDNLSILDIMSQVLQLYGANIYTAKNGAEGLEQARQNQPDFILVDLSMPIMNGFEMIRRLKSDPKTAALPVIVLSALSSGQDRQQAVEAGCDSFLSKPIMPTTFLPTLMNELKRIPHLADRFAAEANS